MENIFAVGQSLLGSYCASQCSDSPSHPPVQSTENTVQVFSHNNLTLFTDSNFIQAALLGASCLLVCGVYNRWGSKRVPVPRTVEGNLVALKEEPFTSSLEPNAQRQTVVYYPPDKIEFDIKPTERKSRKTNLEDHWTYYFSSTSACAISHPPSIPGGIVGGPPRVNEFYVHHVVLNGSGSEFNQSWLRVRDIATDGTVQDRWAQLDATGKVAFTDDQGVARAVTVSSGGTPYAKRVGLGGRSPFLRTLDSSINTQPS